MDTIPNSIERRKRIVQNQLLIWLDESMDETNEDYKHILTQIQTDAGNVNVFTQRNECVDFLSDNEDIKSFLVVENNIAQQIISLINDIPQLDGVYIFSNNKSLDKQWTNIWQKIKSVQSNIDDLCRALQSGIKTCSQDSIAMSIFAENEMASSNDLNQLEPTFMYTQIFKDILLDMEHGKQATKKFTSYCRQNNSGSIINIDRFDKEYNPQSAIWWYTYPSFIYSMLNYALRSMESDIIINMGFFIHDLHLQIHQLHQQQFNTDHSKPFTVYRGQGLSKASFEKLQRTKGCLMSFNNFLSTSMEQDIALGLACSASQNEDMVGILFVISIDPKIKSSPFASIKEVSYFKEEDEILFSMHTVFRVRAIKVMDINDQLYQVELQLTSDDDQQLRLLTDRIRKEADGINGWDRLGSLLIKIGQFNKAEELYNVLLKQTSHEDEKQCCYNRLGNIKDGQGDYEKAIEYYEQALEIYQKTLPSNYSGLTVSTYGNIGTVYNHMGEYPKALSFYEKALEICQKTLPTNYLSLAILYNNIGNVYDRMGEYSKTLSFYEEALEIYEKTLPSNHPLLAISYNNIGLVYNNMEKNSNALLFFEKALEIQQKTLPSNHPDLASLYANIGSVHCNMGEYSKALSFSEKALEIQQKTLPSNHLDVIASYNTLGLVYYVMGKFSKALSFQEKALEICQKTLPSNHPDLATAYCCIGSSHNRMGEYSKALSAHEKALEIYQKTLLPNHSSLATSYNNIGFVYYSMKDYSKALSYYERALNILKRVLPPTHPNIKTTKENIEDAKEKMIKNK
ncbi:unnamed protein product [Adineta steineri]|uniref:NAD(P)(+)--arginine ADP-ribosyltransferase n=1 Tax=Adineta steineri TaxID=433720 RepID=A0A819P5X4_9BILA|nr:unnamed protein product [Adineta steineri]CAF4007421.1 unnamed protein product [Adineta steineri]